MKKKLITFLVFGTILCLFVFLALKNLDTRIKINSWFSKPNKEFVTKNKLKTIEINLTKEEQNHFKRLFRDFYAEGLGPENNEFLEYYSNHNEWIKTELKVDSEIYNVKIKSQGRTPYAHKFGKNFSLTVKFLDKTFPFYSKRVNLIIYNRIQLKNDLLKTIATKFNLLRPEFKLASVNINNQGEYLYFIEERIDGSFFKTRKSPMIIFNKGINGGLIYNKTQTNTELSIILAKELQKKEDLSNNLKLRIKQNYKSINNSILRHDISTLKSLLDLDYMSKLNAFRVIYGSDGHGFNSDNFEMAYDTVKHLFYPIVHRDMNTTTLQDCNSPYNFMDNKRSKIPFWILLDSDPEFIKSTKQQIDLFLKTYSDSINIELKEIHNYYKNSHTFERYYLNNGFDGNSIINNINCLNQ